MTTPTPTPTEAVSVTDERSRDTWQLVVWNDEVNLFTYVVYVLQQRFELSYQQARQLTWQIHERGSAVALTATRAEVETHCQALHICGIQATVRAA